MQHTFNAANLKDAVTVMTGLIDVADQTEIIYAAKVSINPEAILIELFTDPDHKIGTLVIDNQGGDLSIHIWNGEAENEADVFHCFTTGK